MSNQRHDMNHSSELSRRVPTVQEVCDALPEWGRAQRGGLPSGYKTLWPDGVDLMRQAAGWESNATQAKRVYGKETKPHANIATPEWSLEVTLCDKAWRNLVDPDHHAIFIVEYVTHHRDAVPVKAKAMNLKSRWRYSELRIRAMAAFRQSVAGLIRQA